MTSTKPETRYDRYILIIILVSLVVRLIHITDPPIEVAHNWRQTTSLMVARNFYQHDNNILYPTLDETGDRPGVVGMEFPALPYSIYLVSEVFGYDHWYGRLINLLVVCAGLFFFYRLVGLYFEKRIAFFATIALTFSALFHLARKVLPDPMSMSLVIMGLYFGTRYLREGKVIQLFAYFLLASLGALVKIPFGSYLIILAFPFFSKNTTGTRRLLFAVVSAGVITIVFWWYFFWNMHLSETYGLWYNSGRSLGEGIKELALHFGDVLERFYFSAFHSFVFFGLTVAGLVMSVYQGNRKVWRLVLICIPVFAAYMFKSGFLFAHHGYYALVIVPLMALLVGVFLNSIPSKWATILLLIGIGESVANQQHDFFIKDREFVKLQVADIAGQTSAPEDLVALVSNANPNEFYFLNRRGWMVSADQLNTVYLDSLAGRGCKLLYMRKGKYNEDLPYERVFENQDYLVFDLLAN